MLADVSKNLCQTPITKSIKPKRKANIGDNLVSRTEQFVKNTSKKISLTYCKRHLTQKNIPRVPNNCIPKKEIHRKLHC